MTQPQWIDMLIKNFSNVGGEIIAYLPRLLAATVLLVIGWLVARLIRAVVIRLVRGIDNLWHRAVVRNDLAAIQSRYPPTKIVGEISFWVVTLLFLSLAANILGLTAFVSWISQVVSFIPLLIASLVIIVAGIILSSLIRDLITSAASSAGTAQAVLLGRIAQFVILVTAIVIGIDQVGIDISFFSVIAGIILATTLSAVAIAFGIGAKDHMANIIAGRYLHQQYRVGDKIRIRDIEGKIIKMQASLIVVDTADGQVSIPAKIFNVETAVLIEREE